MFFGWWWIIRRPYPALRVLMERPSDLFTYLCLEVGTSYLSDLFEDLVGNNALSSQRTVIDVLRFIYLFIFFLFLVLFFSPLRACRGWFIRRARLCRKTSFILPWLGWTPQKPLQDGIWHVATSIFSLSLLQCRYFLFVCVRSFFFVVHFFLLKTANRFLHSIFGILRPHCKQTPHPDSFQITVSCVCVCVYKGAIVSIFNMRTISLSLSHNTKKKDVFFCKC